ncbi:MAG: hypothetical protein JWM57_708 [Phycisphaerales bacterium]|nr:hypothetical protein [Phycisphaerales bacterium]
MMNDSKLVAAQYATDEILQARIELHDKYTVGPMLEPAVDAALALSGEECLLDVGTGPAGFPRRLRREGHRGRLVGVDLNPGMFPAGLAEAVELLPADAAALPFADCTFDVVTARHMLYHVPDVLAALTEMKRVLTPGGRFLALTNYRDSLAGFWDTVAEAERECPALGQIQAFRQFPSFNDANAAAAIKAVFGNVTLTTVDSRLEVTEVAALEKYFLSCLPGRDIDADAALAAFRAALRRRFPLDGPWKLSKAVLLLTAHRKESYDHG